MEEASFNIPSLSCSVCSGRIQGELKGMNGVRSVDVDLKAQSVRVSYDPDELRQQDIRKKIAAMGYEVLT
jgi:copper chaperone